MAVKIDRCVCHGHTFDELKRVAREWDESTVEGLQRHVEFGRTCRLCHPYVRRMLRTGETEFRTILTAGN